jgi:hypothetical protein
MDQQRLVMFFVLLIAILTRVRNNFNIVLICVSLVGQGVEFFHVFIGICTSFAKCLFSCIAQLLVG